MKKINLLLLPGLVNDAHLWQPQILGLAEVAESIVGDISGANSIAALAAAATAQMPEGPFAVAGLSLGGYVALEIMRQAPERVLALALLDTSARPDTPEATENRHKQMQLAETNFPGVIDALLPKLLHPIHLNDIGIARTVAGMARASGKDVFIRQQQAIIGRIDSRPHLPQIACPTLILCGREDTITPVTIHEEMHSAIPNSTLSIITTCGHLSTLSQPQQVTSALRTWLLAIKL